MNHRVTHLCIPIDSGKRSHLVRIARQPLTHHIVPLLQRALSPAPPLHLLMPRGWPNRLISRPPIADKPDAPPAALPKAADTSPRSDRPGQTPPSGELADPLRSTAKPRSPPCLYHTLFRPTPTHHPVTPHPARPSSSGRLCAFLIRSYAVEARLGRPHRHI